MKGKKEREKASQQHCLGTLVEAGKTLNTAAGCHLKMEALLLFSEHNLKYIRCIMTSYNS